MSLQRHFQALLLRVCVRGNDAEALAGDLLAEGERQRSAGLSAFRIALWEWRQVLIACAYGAALATGRVGRMRFPLGADLRLAVRSLTHRPAAALAMILTIALGIGANAVGFTVLDALLLRPLPFPQADRLVVLREFKPSEPAGSGGVSYLNFTDWRAQNRAFESMALVAPQESSLAVGGSVVPVSGLLVSPGFFRTLGVPAAQGSTFDSFGDEDTTAAGGWPVMLTDRGWRRHFRSAPDVVGKTVELDGQLAQIVGVTPAGIFPLVEEPIDYWATTRALGRAADTSSANGSRNFRQYAGVLARLREDSGVDMALADLKRVQGSLAIRYPNAFKGRDVRIDPLREILTAPAAPVAWLLYALVTVVWLVACVNVTNMSLARVVSRRREVSVRRALGASRWAVTRQFFVENLVVSVLGAVSGMALAAWLLAVLVPLLPSSVPALGVLTPDARVLAMALILAIVTAVICGALPGWLAVRSSGLQLALSEGRQPSIGVPRSLRDGLIALQVALAMVLLSAAGLLTNSLVRLQRQAPGFDLVNIWTTRLSLTDPLQVDDIKTEVARIAGVTGVAFSQSVPFTGFDNSTQVSVEGAVTAEASTAQLRFVTPEYFALMAIPAIGGRHLSDRDSASAPAVAVVNEAFVRTYLPSGLAVGRRLSLGWGGDGPKTIVGVVGNVRHRGPGDSPRPEVYVPQAQFTNTSVSLLVRMAPGVIPSADDLYRAIAAVRPDMPRQPVRALSEYRADTLSSPRFSAIVLGGLAGVSLLLAAVGLYGITVFLTGQRTQEIGVRMALGAAGTSVVWLVMRQAMRPVAWGVPLGAFGAWAATGTLRRWLFGVEPTDPSTMAVVIGLLMLVAGTACAVPARRAARVDPVTALRAD